MNTLQTKNTRLCEYLCVFSRIGVSRCDLVEVSQLLDPNENFNNVALALVTLFKVVAPHGWFSYRLLPFSALPQLLIGAVHGFFLEKYSHLVLLKFQKCSTQPESVLEQVATQDQWTVELYSYALSIPAGERSVDAAKSALQ